MVLEFYNTKDDYAAFHSFRFWKGFPKRLKRQLIVAGLLALYAGIASYRKPFSWETFLIVIALTAAGFMFFSTLFSLFFYFLSFTIGVHLLARTGERKCIILTPDVLVFERGVQKRFYKWEDVRSVEVNRSSVYIVVRGNRTIIVNGSSFSSKEGLDYFVEQVRASIPPKAPSVSDWL